MLKKLLIRFLEIFFPSHCLNCQVLVSKSALFCPDCFKKVKFITNSKCEICSYPFEVEIKNALPFCGKCLIKKPSFDKVVTLFKYNYVIKKIIGAIKYQNQGFLGKKFAKMLVQKIKKEEINFDLIIAVPLHIERLKKRKFNQSIFLAKSLAKELNKDFFTDLLFRVKNSKPQAKLRKKERIKNVKRAFIVNKKYRDFVAGKNILLVDDVMTSGATVENCAKELKRRKANKVFVVTIAKAVF